MVDTRRIDRRTRECTCRRTPCTPADAAAAEGRAAWEAAAEEVETAAAAGKEMGLEASVGVVQADAAAGRVVCWMRSATRMSQ